MEILTKHPNPQYDAIMKHLTGAIDKAKGKTGMGNSWLRRKVMGSVRHEPIFVKAKLSEDLYHECISHLERKHFEMNSNFFIFQ